MIEFDKRAVGISDAHGLVYSRYADDLCLSTDNSTFSRGEATTVIGKIYRVMTDFGLSPNITKTRVSPPGGRKVTLGLLVDGSEPKLTREFRASLRQHIYYITHPTIGPAKHAAVRRFDSVMGLRNHIQGLISYARHIDPSFADT
ncbi:MAG: reverse transcriptase family protein, partial [Gammaproteobacteria bacterium]